MFSTTMKIHMNVKEDRISTSLETLPEDIVSEILALTSPQDACRLSIVSKSLRSSATSDVVWDKLLPSYYQSIIAGSVTPIPDFRSMKELYVYLSHNFILIDGGRKSFYLEKWTGKKCYFLGARDLKIEWDIGPDYWNWTSVPESRFPEVAMLKFVFWLEIRGTISAGILSPHTSYAAYFVYKLKDEFGFDYRAAEVSVGKSGVESEIRYAFLEPEGKWHDDDVEDDWDYDEAYDNADKQLPKLRNDGWYEVELGEFVSEQNGDACIEMCLREAKGIEKEGLILEGIEVRPIITKLDDDFVIT